MGVAAISFLLPRSFLSLAASAVEAMVARMNTAAKRMFRYYAIGAKREPKSQKGVVTAYRQLRRYEMYLPLSFAVVIAIRCHCGKVINHAPSWIILGAWGDDNFKGFSLRSKGFFIRCHKVSLVTIRLTICQALPSQLSI